MPSRFARCATSAVIAGMLVTAAAAAARAGDGRIEINQACAEDTGCGPDDSPGFPVTLVTGSYVLTGNLEVTSTTASAILVGDPHVWLDLGGFTIQGPNRCPGPEPCTPVGGGIGILAFSSYTTVLDGTIRGFGAYGIDMQGEHARIEEVFVGDNGTAGLRCGDGSLVRHVRAVRNSGMGITTEILTSLNHKAVVLVGSLADRNGSHGIQMGEGSVIAENLSDGNGGAGIDALVGGHAIHDNRARQNAGNGIRAGAGSIVEGNSAVENAVLGLFLNPAAAYGFNVIRSDPAVAGSATVNAGAQSLSGNLCNGVPTCP